MHDWRKFDFDIVAFALFALAAVVQYWIPGTTTGLGLWLTASLYAAGLLLALTGLALGKSVRLQFTWMGWAIRNLVSVLAVGLDWQSSLDSSNNSMPLYAWIVWLATPTGLSLDFLKWAGKPRRSEAMPGSPAFEESKKVE